MNIAHNKCVQPTAHALFLKKGTIYEQHIRHYFICMLNLVVE